MPLCTSARPVPSRLMDNSIRVSDVSRLMEAIRGIERLVAKMEIHEWEPNVRWFLLLLPWRKQLLKLLAKLFDVGKRCRAGRHVHLPLIQENPFAGNKRVMILGAGIGRTP